MFAVPAGAKDRKKLQGATRRHCSLESAYVLNAIKNLCAGTFMRILKRDCGD